MHRFIASFSLIFFFLSIDIYAKEDVSTSHLNKLPIELVRMIFSQSTPQEVLKFKLVSKEFKEYAEDNELWQNLYKRYIGPAEGDLPKSWYTKFKSHQVKIGDLDLKFIPIIRPGEETIFFLENPMTLNEMNQFLAKNFPKKLTKDSSDIPIGFQQVLNDKELNLLPRGYQADISRAWEVSEFASLVSEIRTYLKRSTGVSFEIFNLYEFFIDLGDGYYTASCASCLEWLDQKVLDISALVNQERHLKDFDLADESICFRFFLFKGRPYEKF